MISYACLTVPGECKIIKNGWRERAQCYDCDGPFQASFQRWYCTEHKKSFSATTQQPELQDVISKQEATYPLLIFPRIVVTQPFVQMVRKLSLTTSNDALKVVEKYTLLWNLKRTARAIKQDWDQKLSMQNREVKCFV